MKQLLSSLFLLFATVASPATLTIDGSQTYQIIDGFGVNANHRSWTNNELKPVFDSLIDQAGMTLFRVLYDKADWESSNDDADPDVMNWSYYNSIYSSSDFEKLWGVMAYLNQRGITDGLMLNFQGGGPEWMGGSPLTPGFEDEWAEMVASLFIYARNNRNLKFSLVAPDNEPDITAQGVDMSLGQYVTAMRKLSQLLDANGMSELRFVGPDLSSTSTAWLTAMMNDSTLAAKIAHFGFHDYSDGGTIAGIYDFLQNSAYPDRSIWVTEFNVWCSVCEDGGGGTNSWSYARNTADYLLSDLANGASAAFVWEGYDSQYNYYCPGCWSYWGLFGVDDINASPKAYTPRKQFYTVSQITKFVRPGAKRIDVSGSFGPLTVLAFYNPELGQITLVGDNPSDAYTTVSGTFTSLPNVGSLDLYYTSADANLSRPSAYLVTNQSFTVTIPPDCIFTLTSAVASTVPAGSYVGLYHTENGISPESCGSFSLSLTPRSTFTGTLLSSAGRYALSGRFDANGHFVKTISHRGLRPLTVDLQYSLSQNIPLITGTITSDTWSATGGAWHSGFNARTSPAPQAGHYTIFYQGDTGATNAPAGDGYAAMTITPSGKVRILGSLADGTKFTSSSLLSDNCISSFCFFPYASQGLFTQWESLFGADAMNPFGTFTWIKPAMPDARSYPAGFLNNFYVHGSPYSPPAKGKPILNSTNAELVLLEGSLSAPITNHLTLNAGNKVTSPEHAALTFNPSMGTFKGSAVDSNQQSIPFFGAILTNQSLGDGFFLDSDQSGQILLLPKQP